MEEQLVRIREELYRSRDRRKRWGIGLALFGLITILDSGSPFPIPLVGLSSIVVGLLCTFGGFFLLYQQQELPIRESLEVSALYDGFLSAPLLIRGLHITPNTAERILAELVQHGYIRIDEASVENGELGYRVLGLQAPASPSSLPPADPGA